MQLVLAFQERLAVFNAWNAIVEAQTSRPEEGFPRIADGIERIWDITRQVYPSAELGTPAAQLREFEGYSQGIRIISASADEARKISGWRLILDRLAKDTRNMTLRQLVRSDAPLARQFEADWVAPLFERMSQGFPSGTHFMIWNWLILQTRASHNDVDMGLTGHWHFDTHYPRDYFKIMIFINDTSEHGSGTDFLDAEASQRLSSKSGYVGFAPNRIGDLGPLAEDPIAITEFRPTAGDAVIFWPSRVLHRGVYPRQGVRYALSFSMMPVYDFQSRDQFVQNFRTADSAAVEGQDLPPFYVQA